MIGAVSPEPNVSEAIVDRAQATAGCSIKAVPEGLGHATAAETLDTYSHLWPADDDRIRDAVEAAHAGSDSHVTVASRPS